MRLPDAMALAMVLYMVLYRMALVKRLGFICSFVIMVFFSVLVICLLTMIYFIPITFFSQGFCTNSFD